MLDCNNLPSYYSNLEQADSFLLSERKIAGSIGGQERAVIRVNTGHLEIKAELGEKCCCFSSHRAAEPAQPGSSSATFCSRWRKANIGSNQLLLQHGCTGADSGTDGGFLPETRLDSHLVSPSEIFWNWRNSTRSASISIWTLFPLFPMGVAQPEQPSPTITSPLL